MTKKFPEPDCVIIEEQGCSRNIYYQEDIDEWKKQDDKKKEDLKKYLEEEKIINDFVISSKRKYVLVLIDEILKRLES